jgi:O-antigen/teichoic acid export membrane protein
MISMCRTPATNRSTGVQMTTKHSPDIGRTVLRNTIVVTAGNWASKLLFLGFNIVVVRWLGEVALGEYATIIAFVGLFGLLFNLGMSQAMERSVARDPAQAATSFWNLVAIRLLLAAAGVVVIPCVAVITGYDRRIVAGVLLYALSYVLSALLIPLTGVLRAHEQFDVVMATMLVSRIVSIVVGLSLLWLDAGFFALLVAGFVAIPIQVWVLARAARALGIDLAIQRIDRRSWPTMIKTGIPFGLLAMGLSFNANVVTIVLGQFEDAASVGWYNAAYRLIFHLVGIMGGFLVAMSPSLTRMYRRDPEQVIRWTSTTFHWLVLLVLPTSAGLSLVAPDVVRLLYGISFAPADAVLRVLAWDITLMLVVAYFATVCAAVGRERVAAWVYLGGILLNTIVSIAVITAFGRTGAAISNIVIDGSSTIVFAVILSRNGWIIFDPSRLARMSVATGLMGVIVWICRPLPLPVEMAVGASTYVVLAVAFGLLEAKMIVAAVGRRLGLAPRASH